MMLRLLVIPLVLLVGALGCADRTLPDDVSVELTCESDDAT